MKLTKSQLRKLINEELGRLDELHPGSAMGSYLKQGVAKLWEADNMIQRGIAEASTDQEHSLLTAIHNAIEKLAFAVDEKMQHIVSGNVNVKKKAPLPTPKKVGSGK
ncbi:MAG: hypothetical protein WCT13_05555 [Patescibacteria group bacterium]|jgi:hypothetical protein